MIGTTLNQRFALEKELGRGGMGAVYRATDLVLGRTVAIKVLKDQTGEEVGRRLRLEAQILARLLHDNIVRLYDFGESDGLHYFVMEEVDGTSFRRRWRELELPGRLLVLAEVADALDYAHHQGVIHRDVKPANVLLTAADRAKLSDFGLSMAAGAEADEPGLVKGTPHYMSPEQARGGRLDYRCDLYALGVMLYECATGTTPFQGASYAVMVQHVNTEPDPPRARNPGVAPQLDDLIRALMAKRPADRPSSGAEVARSIRSIAASLAAPAGAEAAPGGPARVSASASASASSSISMSGSVAAPTAIEKRSVGRHPAAQAMLDAVLAEPLPLSPDERYLCGHYLAYLLGGSPRTGILRRRPLDALNADRARLMLAMAYLSLFEDRDEEALARAVDVIEVRPEVRPALNPVVVMKYLAARGTAARRKRFRAVRKAVQDASEYAATRLTDARGVLNPGLMPQTLDDLRVLAPARVEVDDELVARWNRLAAVWRDSPRFRLSVLRSATRAADRDPASVGLWPEVVYPLIERARWQRKRRTTPEVLYERLLDGLRLQDDGHRMDDVIREAVPADEAELLEAELDSFEEDPTLEPEPADRPADDGAASGSRTRIDLGRLGDDLLDAGRKGLVPLAQPEPVRLLMNDLRELYDEALRSMQAGAAAGGGHRRVPIGPYTLAVIPSVRGRSAGQVAIQGMRNKQIEMLVPPIRLASAGTRPIVAAWVYRDDSLAIAYLDHRNTGRYIFWHAPTAAQDVYDDPDALRADLHQRNIEAPEALERALSKRYRPRNAV